MPGVTITVPADHVPEVRERESLSGEEIDVVPGKVAFIVWATDRINELEPEAVAA